MLKHPCARAHPGCEVNCQGLPNQLASSLHLCFVEASLTVKKAVLCYKGERFVASLSSFCTVQSSLAVCRYDAAGGRTLRTRPQTVVCKPLMSDVVAPKVHHNNSSYASPADLPLGSLCKNSAWWAVTRRTSKKTVKIGWWALAWDNMVIAHVPHTFLHHCCICIAFHVLYDQVALARYYCYSFQILCSW